MPYSTDAIVYHLAHAINRSKGPVFRQGEQATHGALRPPFSPELLQHFQSELRQRATQKPVPN